MAPNFVGDPSLKRLISASTCNPAQVQIINSFYIVVSLIFVTQTVRLLQTPQKVICRPHIETLACNKNWKSIKYTRQVEKLSI